MMQAISLDLDHATLAEILASLCKQTGLVYETRAVGPGTAGWIGLGPGEMSADCRPSCSAGDYTIRVTSVGSRRHRSLSLHWGSMAPERWPGDDGLGVALEERSRMNSILSNLVPFAIVGVLVSVAVRARRAPLWAEAYRRLAHNRPHRLKGKHLPGNDGVGNDVPYMTLKGCRTALIIGGLTSLIATPLALHGHAGRLLRQASG